MIQAHGKSESRTRWPVKSGKSAVSFSATGLGARTGQSWHIVCVVFLPSNSVSKMTSWKPQNYVE
jgi:hypothetical protein